MSNVFYHWQNNAFNTDTSLIILTDVLRKWLDIYGPKIANATLYEYKGEWLFLIKTINFQYDEDLEDAIIDLDLAIFGNDKINTKVKVFSLPCTEDSIDLDYLYTVFNDDDI